MFPPRKAVDLECKLGAGPHAELPIELGQIPLDRLNAELERFRDFAIRPALRDSECNSLLGLVERASNVVDGSSPSAMTESIGGRVRGFPRD
jgi:hypothetical protein